MTASMTTAQLVALVTEHMSAHGLAEPVSLNVTVSAIDQQQARVQLGTIGLAATAAGLLAWANTHAAVAFEAWRPQNSGSVHLDLRTTLAGPHGTAGLLVFGAVDFDAAVFPTLEPGARHPLPLGQLMAWAGNRTGVAA